MQLKVRLKQRVAPWWWTAELHLLIPVQMASRQNQRQKGLFRHENIFYTAFNHTDLSYFFVKIRLVLSIYSSAIK